MSALNAHGDMVMSNTLSHFVDSTGVITRFIPVTWPSERFFQHQLYSYDGSVEDVSLTLWWILFAHRKCWLGFLRSHLLSQPRFF